MGLATIGAAIGLGAQKQQQAQKRAREAAYDANQREINAQSQIRTETQRMNEQIGVQQKRIAEGQARSNRRRIRGGLFGRQDENQQPGAPLNARLG